MTSHRRLLLVLAALFVVAAPQPAGAGFGSPAETRRASVSSAGVEGDAESKSAMVSADGLHVAFASCASTLVPDDHNAIIGEDAFVHDLDTGKTVRVSVTTDGREAMAHSHFPAISADGRFVAFENHDRLDDTPRPGATGLYVRDRDTDRDGYFDEVGAVETRLASVDADGIGNPGNASAAAISGDGASVVFTLEAASMLPEDDNGMNDVYLRDRDTDRDGVLDEAGAARTVLISRTPDGRAGNGASGEVLDQASVSTAGRLVAFASGASDLAAGDGNDVFDVFVHDRDTDVDGVFDEPGEAATERVSVGALGVEADAQSREPSISADGRYVAFSSNATNLVTGDLNGMTDVFVHDRVTGHTTLVSAGTGGSRPSISGDGRFVAYDTLRGLLGGPALLGCDADLPEDATAQVLLHDRDADGDGVFDETVGTATEVASQSSSGVPGLGMSWAPSVSGDGATVAFASDATNLVAGDANGVADVFARLRSLTCFHHHGGCYPR
ncbi:MAG: PD40 domain-containing protein [Actinobacteria bacterium]|nr:PD40 domain-containing protein [Actinomycetota bacterium]